MAHIRSKQISLGQFSNVYIPFGILVVLALFAAEQTQNLDLARTRFTIWVTTVLLIPTLCLFVFSGQSKAKDNYWLLLWTFSFLSYFIHFYYGTFVEFDGFADTFIQQGTIIAGSNFLLTLWWAGDVILSWVSKTTPRWAWIQRIALHIFIFGAFAITDIILRGGPIRALGIVFTVAIVLCVLVRVYLIFGRKPQPPAVRVQHNE